MAMLTIQTDNIPPALPPIAFVFKLNPLPPTVTPFLVPRINNPDFDILNQNPPGIVQFTQGNIGITSAIVGAVMAPITAIIDNIQSITDEVINEVNDAVESAKETAKSAADQAKETAKSAADQAKETANQAKETAKSAADQAKETANQAKETAKSAADQAKETANQAKETVASTSNNDIAASLQESVQNALAFQFANMPNIGSLPELPNFNSDFKFPTIPNIANPLDGIKNPLKDFKMPKIDTSELMPSGSDLINNAIPQDSGLLSFEKMTIKSFLETYKPIMEAITVLIEMLADAEDAVARFLGSSIKIPIVNIWVGIPSKKPYYTKGALNYGDPDSMNKDYILKENIAALKGVLGEFKETANIFGGIPGNSVVDVQDYDDPQQAYYIGYFDEDGKTVLPPNWVLNSGKWFGRKWGLTDNNEQPDQLSNDQNIGIAQLKTKYKKKLRILDIEKNKLSENYSYQENDQTQSEADRVNATKGKEQALNMMQEFIDVVDDSVHKSIYPEWFTKHVVSQLKTLYNEPFISTAEPVLDKKGKPKEPYVTFPKIVIDDQEVEVTVVESENQVVRKKVKEGKKKRKKIVGLNTTTGANGETIIGAEETEDTKILYWSHIKETSSDQQVIKQTKIPDDVKRFYLAHDYEIVLEYEIRDLKTGQVLATEQEVVPQTIDFEKDYKLRLIRVINKPTNDKLKKLNDKKFSTKSSALSYLKNTFDKNYNSKTGTMYATNNTIPEKYDETVNGMNKHSAEVLDKNNKLFEGEIKHGVDPRFNGFRILKYKKKVGKDKIVATYNITNLNNIKTTKSDSKYYYKIEQYKYQVFWLVEAIKLSDDGTFSINNKLYDNNAGEDNTKDKNTNNGGKEWYGLLDKFTAIIVIVTRLIPKIARKFIPLIIKVIQILINPFALADLVFLIITEKLSKLFGMFDTKFNSKSKEDMNNMSGDSLAGAGSKFHYKSPSMKSPINVADGKKYVEIFGFFIGMASIDGELKLYYTKKQYEKETKDLPEHGLLNFILKLIKLPFDIIEKIVKFLIDFIKKLINPFTMLKALIDFITFKWLIDILTAAIAAIAALLAGNFGMYDKILQSKNSTEMNNEILATLQSEDIPNNLVRVYVYHIFKNGKYMREEIEEKPLDDAENSALPQSYFPPPGVELTDELKEFLNDTNPGNKEGPGNPPFPFPISCGIADIPLNTFMPSPFVCKSPNFNICDLTQLYTKPLDQIFAQLSFIQGIIQGLIALPFSALGLSPYIPMPKIDFVTPIKEKVYSILENLMPNIVPTENTDLLKLPEINVKDLMPDIPKVPNLKELAAQNVKTLHNAINKSSINSISNFSDFKNII